MEKPTSSGWVEEMPVPKAEKGFHEGSRKTGTLNYGTTGWSGSKKGRGVTSANIAEKTRKLMAGKSSLDLVRKSFATKTRVFLAECWSQTCMG